jgi:hypothetical protein
MRLGGKEASYEVAEVNSETRPTFLSVFGLSFLGQSETRYWYNVSIVKYVTRMLLRIKLLALVVL